MSLGVVLGDGVWIDGDGSCVSGGDSGSKCKVESVPDHMVVFSFVRLNSFGVGGRDMTSSDNHFKLSVRVCCVTCVCLYHRTTT